MSENSAARHADVQLDPIPADVSTSAEAVKVLQEQGVDAWREWVAAQR